MKKGFFVLLLFWGARWRKKSGKRFLLRTNFFFGKKRRRKKNSTKKKETQMDATGPPDARELAAFSELEGKLVDASRRVKTVRWMQLE